MAKDNHNLSVTDTFELQIINSLTYCIADYDINNNQSTGSFIDFTIDKDTYFEDDDDFLFLTFTAFLDWNSLPNWLDFDPNTL